MNPRLKALHNQLQALIDRANSLGAKAEMTDDERAEASALPDQIAAKRAEIDQANALASATADANQFLNGAPAAMAVGGGVQPGQAAPGGVATLQPLAPAQAPSITLPGNLGLQVKDERTVRLISRARPRYLTQIPGVTREEASLKAYRFGMSFLATFRGDKTPGLIKRCQDQGIPLFAAAQQEGVDEDGGYLVPPEFDNDIIDLKEKYGVIRLYARNVLMMSDTKSRPRRKGGLEAYFVDEAEAADDSNTKWDRVGLTAKKLMVNTRLTSEWNEDAIVNTGDMLIREIAYAFAKKEDRCGFIGDGGSAFGGMVGITTRLLNVYGTGGGIGLILASGNAWGEFTLEDHTKVLGNLPEYADNPDVAWYCHKVYFATVMLRLMLAAGGVTAAEIATGAVYRNPTFLGYPVRFVQAMPKTQANSQVPVVFGDVALAVDYGDRRQHTIAMSEHVHFKSDEIAMRGTERFDINVHDVGDATDAGPVVGLLSQSA